MYNHELLNKMIDKFGMRKTVEFSKMASFMYKTIHENNPNVPEANYESEWWRLKYEEMISKTNNKTKHVRITRKKSLRSRSSERMVFTPDDGVYEKR